MSLSCSSGNTRHHGVSTGCSSYYPSDSARILLKECFTDNPAIQLDPHQQWTEMSLDQMIQFARAIGLEVALATFRALEDVLLKVGRQYPLFSRARSTVIESVVSRSFYSLLILQNCLVVVLLQVSVYRDGGCCIGLYAVSMSVFHSGARVELSI